MWRQIAPPQVQVGMVGGTGFEPVTPTVSWESSLVRHTDLDSTEVSWRLIL